MSHSIKNCGIIIIAAGQSKRLGTPKQLLVYEGKTLINRLIDNLKTTFNFPMVLVLGAYADKIKSQLIDPTINVIVNDVWTEGMGTSINAGLQEIIKKNANIDGVVVLVCDQPFVNSNHILSLLSLQKKSGKPIAACYYANILGTPALFHQSVFPELLKLKGDVGAKKLINEKIEEVDKLHFEQGLLDIDTVEDYLKLIKEA